MTYHSPLRPFLRFALLLSMLIHSAGAEKTLCEHANYVVSSKPASAGAKPLYYYQRLELPDVVDCVERCIETGEYCRAVLWISHVIDEDDGLASGKLSRPSLKKIYCEFYSTNSEDPINKGKEIGSEAQADSYQYTFYEIVDRCPRPSLLIKRLSVSSKRALEALPSNSQANQRTTAKPNRVITATVDFRTPHNDLRNEGLATGKFRQRLTKSTVTERGVEDADILAAPSPGPKRNSGLNPPLGRLHRDQPYRTAPTEMEGPVGGGGGLSATDGLEPIRPVVVSRGGFASSPQSLGAGYVGPPKFSSQLQQPHSSVPSSGVGGGSGRKEPCPARPGSGDACAPKEPPQPVWTEWSSGGVCSVNCGAGRRKMHRYCSGRKSDDCPGNDVKEEACEMPECNQWSEWSEWGRCSASCGSGGHKTRHRSCRYGDACEGTAEERDRCDPNDVPRECPEWMPWAAWGDCSVSCGRGSQHRERACDKRGSAMECSEMGGGGHSTDHQNCEMRACPEWAPWQQWGECSKSCGGGERVRQRECLNGAAGEDCPGPGTEHTACNAHPCPQWAPWAQWGPCSTTCGDDGTRLRSRECVYQGRLSNDCEGGSAQDESPCQLAPCPHWGEWADWSKCSTTCGHGQQLRMRECAPRGFGCKGGDREIRFCQLAVCPYFSAWSEWSGCSVSCGRGTCERRRKCIENSPLQGAVLPATTEDEPASNTTSDGSAPSGSTGGGGSLEPINGPIKATLDDTSTSRSTTRKSSTATPSTTKAKNAKATSSEEAIETSTTPHGKEADKARLIEKARHLPATESRIRQVKLREHLLEVPQSTSKVLSKRRRSPIRAMSIDDADGGGGDGPLAEMSPHSFASMAIVPTNGRGSASRAKSSSTGTCVGPEVEYKDCDAGPCCEWGDWAAWGSCRPPSRVGGPDDCDEGEQRRGESSASGAPLGSRTRSRTCMIDRASSSIMPVGSVPASRGGGGSFSTDMPYRGHVVPVANNDFYRTAPPHASRYANSGIARGRRQAAFYRQQPPAYPFSGVYPTGRQSQTFPLSRGQNTGADSSTGDDQCCMGPSTESEECHVSVEPASRPSTDACRTRGNPTARRPHFEQDGKKGVAGKQGECFWAAWSAWRECSGSCSQAKRSRERGCIQHGSNCECRGDDLEVEQCKPKHCSSSTSIDAAQPPKMRPKEPLVLPSGTSNQSSMSIMDDVDHDPVLSCYWSDWTEWSRCRSGDYLKQRSRFCVGLRALINNCECMGASIEQTACGNNTSSPTRIPVATTPGSALIAMRQKNLPTSLLKKRVDTEITPLTASEVEPAVKLQSRIIRPLSDPELTKKRQFDAAPISNSDSVDTTRVECDWSAWSEWTKCPEAQDCQPAVKEKSRSRQFPCRSCGGGVAEESASCPIPASCADDSR